MKEKKFIASAVFAIQMLFSINAAAADPFETWSTNFGALVNLAGVEIRTWIKGT